MEENNKQRRVVQELLFNTRVMLLTLICALNLLGNLSSHVSRELNWIVPQK